MRALIFGADGQDGHYLRATCEVRGVVALGVGLGTVGGCVIGDVADLATVDKLVRDNQPDYLFHLAAMSTTRHDVLFENHTSITTGSINILESVRRHCPACKVFITGSGVQFVNTGNPISERAPFEASSAYAAARIASVYWARYYRSLGLKTYVGYLFHHESPLRKPDHVAMKIAAAAKRMAGGSRERLRLRDVTVRKELGFAGDIVEGIWTLVNQEIVHEAVIGTGKAYAIQDWLEACFALIGRDWRDHVDIEPDDAASEYRTLVSDPATIFSLGWRPKVGLRKLAEMMLA